MTLGAALALDLDEVAVDSSAEYDIAGVYSFGRGLFARAPITGAQTAYRKLHRLHGGQLVVSRLKAFEGAVAVVPAGFEGWHLSPEFPTFRCVDGALDAGYLNRLCSWPEFWSRLASASKGIGARRERVQPNDILGLRMHLPSVTEQRRVASRLDRVALAAEELRQRVTRAAQLNDAVVVSAATRLDLSDEVKGRDGWRHLPLGDVLEPSAASISVEPAEEYLIAGIYSFGRGLIDRGPMSGSETSYSTLTRLSAGDIVVSKLNGWEGAVAVVDEAFAGYHVSSEYPAFSPDRQAVLPEFFAGIARSPRFWDDLNTSARGSMVRRRRINPKEFLATHVWLPPVDIQARVAQAIARARTISDARGATAARVDALLPAALNEAFAGLS
jgi:type I restriction enzyme S subunit